MSSIQENFGNGVLACVDDINRLLPGLSGRYDVMVIVSALAEHIGGALRLLMRRNICNAEQARMVLRHIEDTAFHMKSSDLQQGTPPENTAPG